MINHTIYAFEALLLFRAVFVVENVAIGDATSSTFLFVTRLGCYDEVFILCGFVLILGLLDAASCLFKLRVL